MGSNGDDEAPRGVVRKALGGHVTDLWYGHGGDMICRPRSVYFYVETPPPRVLYVGSAEETCACRRDHRQRCNDRPFAFDAPIVLVVPEGLQVRMAEQSLIDLTHPVYNERRAVCRSDCWSEAYEAAREWAVASIEACWIGETL